jgi:acyl-CoA thioester hydrolase
MVNFETNVRVRYCETDAFGIVHHSNYINWFELARVEMMDYLGLPYKSLEDSGFLMPVLEVQIKYLKPSYFDDRLKIIVNVSEPPKARLTVDYEIYRKDDLITTGQTKHTFIDRSGKLVRPPENYLELMHKHFA